MADDDVQYELKTVQAIRGTEARETAKWQKEGWEFVSQDKGTLRIAITFRRPKRKLPWRLIAVSGGAAAVLIAVAAAFGFFDEEPRTAAPAAPPVAVETNTAAPAATPSAAATPSEEEEATEATEMAQTVEGAVITVQNNSDLAELLALTDTCSSAIGDFAAKYQGQTITFDGYIATMNPHGNAKTRYDILLGAGDFSETNSIGPNFQFRDVNTTSDLHLAGGSIPDTIGKGDNLRFTAQVGKYEDTSCLFLLTPAKTESR